MSVPEAVREIVTRNRSIYDCMKMDLINYTALALKIQPQVEKMLGNPVNPNTVVVAIKRFADSFEQKDEVIEKPPLKDARLSVTDGILDVRIPRDAFKIGQASSLFDEFSKIDPDYEFFRMGDSFRFLTEELPDIRKLFESIPNAQSQFSTGLTRISIGIPAGQNRSDVGSYVADLLHANGIEWDDAYFSKDKMIITLSSKDASKAYDVLRSEIAR
ncbi:MAG TPA: ACT domain-containing protein [Nitrosopumilaceae archaeon]|nr:ACT domain-containing protein [Nitrosopumilaceae archaeon]